MFGKKVFAAMLATVLGASLFGANTAKAVIALSEDGDQTVAAVIYATETLVDTVAGHKGYSVVSGNDDNDSPTELLNVTAKIGLGGPQNTFATIRFELSGMVFSQDVMDGNNGDLAIASSHDNIGVRSGGDVGDDYVSFIANRSSATPDRESAVTLTIRQLGVKPGVPGSVTMTVTDSLGPEKYTASYPNAVRTTRGLKEDATPLNLTATVDERFKSFGSETTGTLGSFVVKLAATDPPLRDATGVDADLTDIITGTVEDGSSVTISGDFSFVSRAWLDTMDTCLEDGNLLKMEDGEVSDTMELTPANPPMTDPMYLCISVPVGDDAVVIPETEPYMLTTEYEAASVGAGWPPNGGEHALGSINRDGTTVQIPFLTTWADYNQRIVISNRGANPAEYWIEFRPEEGVTATPNDMYAMGTLDGNSTMVLRAMDVVTLEGRTRTAATLIVEANRAQIDVATVIVNMMTGSTDTVNYDTK